MILGKASVWGWSAHGGLRPIGKLTHHRSTHLSFGTSAAVQHRTALVCSHRQQHDFRPSRVWDVKKPDQADHAWKLKRTAGGFSTRSSAPMGCSWSPPVTMGPHVVWDAQTGTRDHPEHGPDAAFGRFVRDACFSSARTEGGSPRPR